MRNRALHSAARQRGPVGSQPSAPAPRRARCSSTLPTSARCATSQTGLSGAAITDLPGLSKGCRVPPNPALLYQALEALRGLPEEDVADLPLTLRR